VTTGGGDVRKLRADALRNREQLLAAAKTAFTEVGPDVSLEEIARNAGVGIGTLYRHFPTRDALIEDVYRRELEQMAAAADRLLGEMPAGDALRDWMRVFADYLATKRLIVRALNTTAGGAPAVYERSGHLIREAIGRLLDGAIAQGAVRADTRTDDIIQALAGVAYNVDAPGWRENALRLIDIVIAGLRPGAA